MKNFYSMFLKYYSQRTDREKAILIGGMVCVFLIVIYLSVSPIFIKLKKLDQRISEKRDELLEVMDLKANYGNINLKGSTSHFEKDTSLLSFFEGITSRLGITVQSFRPTETDSSMGLKEINAEIKLSNLSPKELSDLLYFLEKDSKYTIWIKKFHVRRTFKDPGKLDVDMVIGAYQAK